MSVSEQRIVVELCHARLRKLSALAVVLAGVLTGWIWGGNAGAGLLLLWTWSFQHDVWSARRRTLDIPLAALRCVRLGERRVLCLGRRFRAWEIFRDELPPGEYARLRRELKGWFERPLN